MSSHDTEHAYLTLDQIRAEELETLVDFDEFCNEHGLRYSLAGGTLLGAVRHKGFIPWDDDIDICMPRPDWDMLIQLLQDDSKATRLEAMPYPGTELYKTPLLKVVDPRIAVQAEAENEQTYLWLDVFPVDGLPSDEKELARLFSKALTIRKTLMVAATTAESGHSRARRAFKYVMGPVLRALHAVSHCGRLLDKLARDLPYGSTPFVGVLTWGLYGVGERVSFAGFEKTVKLEFEGKEFSCMSCWDEYLSGIYGDYMQLPPEDQRITHGMKAWKVDTEERK